MKTITLQIETNSDYTALMKLVQKLGINFTENTNSSVDLTDAEKQTLMTTIQNGGDCSYIKDPVSWQREQRKDRNLPFDN